MKPPECRKEERQVQYKAPNAPNQKAAPPHAQRITEHRCHFLSVRFRTRNQIKTWRRRVVAHHGTHNLGAGFTRWVVLASACKRSLGCGLVRCPHHSARPRFATGPLQSKPAVPERRMPQELVEFFCALLP
jgi:hypothetical protein